MHKDPTNATRIRFSIKPAQLSFSQHQHIYLTRYLKQYLIDKSVNTNYSVKLPLNGRNIEFSVLSKLPESVKVEINTIIEIESTKKLNQTYKNDFFFGYEEICENLARNQSAPLKIILHGPKHSGKTSLCKHLANMKGLKPKIIDLTETNNTSQGISVLLNTFDNTFSLGIQNILVLKNIDSLSKNQHLNTVFSLILNKLEENVNLNVIGTTKDIAKVDKRFLSKQRFSKVIEMGLPSAKDRIKIAQSLLKLYDNKLDDISYQSFVSTLFGYSAYDIGLLIKEAWICALIQNRSSLEECDLILARQKIPPSSLLELQIKVPKVRWSDIGGMEDIKALVQEAVIWPISKSEVFKAMGISPPRGILLYGPPGCSKTLLAKAIATESSMNFLTIKGPELLNPYLGESERNIRRIFEKARSAAPCIIFFDEIDAISAPTNSSSSGVLDRVNSQLLIELDGIKTLRGEKDVVIIAATNRPDLLPTALVRPGRFDRLIYVPPPDNKSRESIFRITLPRDILADNIDYHELASLTEGYSGAEIVAVCREAALKAFSVPESDNIISLNSFTELLNVFKPQIDAEMINFYKAFRSTV